MTLCEDAEEAEALTPEQESALEKRTAVVFKRLDLNGNGLINRDVFERSLRKFDPDAWDDRRLVRRLLRAIDSNADGVVQIEELRTWLARDGDPWDEARESSFFSLDEDDAGEEGPRADAKQVPAVGGDGADVFRRLDLNGDGVIDPDEFKEALSRLDEDNWDDQYRVERLFKAIDADSDGLLQFEEFRTWLRSSDHKWDEVRQSSAFADASFGGISVVGAGEQPGVMKTQSGREDASNHAIEIFERLDINCDGVVDKNEFARALLEHDEDSWNAKTIRRVFRAIDARGKGEISLQDISEWLEGSGDQWDKVRTSPAFARSIGKPSVGKLYQQGRIEEFYEIDKEKVGEGSFGSVHQCTHLVTHVARAVKMILKRKMDKEELESEISIMAELDHPHICRLYEVFQDHNSMYIVLELCLGGHLFDRIVEAESFTERQGAGLMKQIVGGVRYMHEHGVCHRDLKPENFLLRNKGPIENCIVKIVDFGIASRFKQGDRMTERQGTLYYIAPEVLTGDYDEACDIWSCGVILYILLSGYPPFSGNTDEEVLACVRSGNFQFHKDFWSNISSDAKDLIKWQLQFQPRHRCTAAEAMGHVWIRGQAPAAADLPLQAGQLTNMRAFCSENRLKKVALQIIAKELHEEEIQQLKDMFVTLDVNGDGIVTFEELEAGIKKVGNPELVRNISEVATEVDVNKSGSIDYSEFLAAALDKRQYEEEKVCWSAFHAFDRDGNGTISKEELQAVLENGDVEALIGQETASRILTECDQDLDGVISFEEFIQMMRERPTSS